MRKHLPVVYFFLIEIVKYVNFLRQPYSIYITDSLGGSFKKYIANKNETKLKDSLAGNLDEESRTVVNTVFERLIKYPDESNKVKVNKKSPVYGGLLPVETKDSNHKIEKSLGKLAKNLKLPRKILEASTFHYLHGLKLLPNHIISYLQDEHFVDVGAYRGDSAIALKELHYKKIFSIEISQQSISHYIKNLEKNHISKEKYEIINAAVNEVDEDEYIELPDTGSAGFSLMRRNGKYDIIQIKRRSFDSIVKEYEIQPKFIKVDIEGYAMHFVKGALSSLKEYRPVLSVAIYHNPVEFFEIKPFLEKKLDNYIFSIRKLTPGIRNNLCHSEVILLGYPKELE